MYVSELLDEWNLSSCKPASTPFPSAVTELPAAQPNSLPAISDIELAPKYQCLIGCLLYLAITTRPNITYYAMWLGQFNASLRIPISSWSNTSFDINRVQRIWLSAWALPHLMFLPLSMDICRMLGVLMRTGHLMPLTRRVFPAICSISTVHWSLGQPWSRSQ